MINFIKTKPALSILIAISIIIILNIVYNNNPNESRKNKVVYEKIHTAVTALELFYINSKIYYPVDCDYEKFQEEYYVFCQGSPRSGFGGLYWLAGDTGELEIVPVNGKARTHIESISEIEAEDGTYVKVTDRTAVGSDHISDILKLF